jgi:hypothetical protein
MCAPNYYVEVLGTGVSCVASAKTPERAALALARSLCRVHALFVRVSRPGFENRVCVRFNRVATVLVARLKQDSEPQIIWRQI